MRRALYLANPLPWLAVLAALAIAGLNAAAWGIAYLAAHVYMFCSFMAERLRRGWIPVAAVAWRDAWFRTEPSRQDLYLELRRIRCLMARRQVLLGRALDGDREASAMLEAGRPHLPAMLERRQAILKALEIGR